MKFYVIGFLISLSLFANGQNITKSDLKYSEWCVDNSNKNFYKADTIRFYRFLDTLNEIQKLNIHYRELDYNNGKDISKIKLKKNGRVEISDHNVDSWTVFKRSGKWKWQFDVTNQKLTLLYEKQLKFSFLIVGAFEDKLVRKPEDSIYFPNEEIYHLRVLELVRLN